MPTYIHGPQQQKATLQQNPIDDRRVGKLTFFLLIDVLCQRCKPIVYCFEDFHCESAMQKCMHILRFIEFSNDLQLVDNGKLAKQHIHF